MKPASNGVSDLRTDFERPLWILATVVVLVLLLACSNLANLMLARGAAREREMALRLSIGAGRARLLQQLLVEAGAIAVAASVLGTVFARLAAPAIVALLAPRDTPAYLDVRFDGRVLVFAAVVGRPRHDRVRPPAGVARLLHVAARCAQGSSGRHTTRARLLRPLVVARRSPSA